MNADVLNEIFKRRPARDFLRLYPSEKWKEIIPDIFEIGVLNLKNSFNTLKFSKADIKNILEDLRNYNPSQEVAGEEEYLTEKDNNINRNNAYINNRNNNFNNNNNISINDKNDDEDGGKESINENNDDEYDDDKDEENNNDNENNFNDNCNDTKVNMKNSKNEDKKATSSTEVFIPDLKKINNVNYNRPKISYNSTFEEIKEKNIENKRNIGYAESKIKYQIMNDKMNHKAMKKRKISNEDNNENDGSFSFNQNKNNKMHYKNENKREKNTNKNYVINFDKHLNPQKPIEIQKRYDLNKNNFNNINLNNLGNNKMNNMDFNFNSMENDEDDNNYKDYNEENIFNNFNNNNSNNNIDDSNTNQINFGGQLNNFKLEKLNFPKYEYISGFNNNSKYK